MLERDELFYALASPSNEVTTYLVEVIAAPEGRLEPSDHNPWREDDEIMEGVPVDSVQMLHVTVPAACIQWDFFGPLPGCNGFLVSKAFFAVMKNFGSHQMPGLTAVPARLSTPSNGRETSKGGIFIHSANPIQVLDDSDAFVEAEIVDSPRFGSFRLIEMVIQCQLVQGFSQSLLSSLFEESTSGQFVIGGRAVEALRRAGTGGFSLTPLVDDLLQPIWSGNGSDRLLRRDALMTRFGWADLIVDNN